MHKDNRYYQIANTLCKLLTLAIFSVLCFKAANTSLTHDEAYTCTRYVNADVADIINYDAIPLLPNNHILNTLGIKLFTSLFSNNEFFVRLTNLLAFLLFSFSILTLLRRYRNGWILLGGLLLMMGNPYLLDYFSLARGYGLGIAWMMASVTLFITYIHQRKTVMLTFAFIAGALAVISNFTLLNFYLALFAVFGLIFMQQICLGIINGYQTQKYWWQFFSVVLVSLAMAHFIYEPIEKIVDEKQLFGGNTSFWDDKVLSLIKSSLYTDAVSGSWVQLVNVILIALLVVIALMTVYELIKKNFSIIESKGTVLTLLMIVPALSTIAQHHLLGNEYLFERIALFFVPLFMLALIHSLFLLSKIHLTGMSTNVIALVAGIVTFTYTVSVSSPHYYRDWKYDRHTKAVVIEIERMNAKDGVMNEIVISGNWHFEPTLNYYRQQRNYTWMKAITRADWQNNATESNYLLLMETDSIYLNEIARDTVKLYQDPKTYLLK